MPHVEPVTRRRASAGAPAAPAVAAVTRRSVLIGLGLVLLTSILAPYNDQIRQSVYLIGNYLPLVFVAAITVLCVVVNPLLALPPLAGPGSRSAWRWARRLTWYLLAGAALQVVWPLTAIAAEHPVVHWSRMLLAVAFVGVHLPAVPMILFCAVALLVNPLHRAGRLRAGEMAVALGMQLVACGVAAGGFARYFLPALVMPWRMSTEHPWYATYLKHMPSGLFATTNPNSVTATNFLFGVDPRGGGTLWTTWLPWIAPVATWMLFFVPVFGAMLLLAAILRKQWVQHERLAFPLATIPLELLAPPATGRHYNALWRDRLLWFGAGASFVLYVLWSLSKIDPNIPAIPLRYSMWPYIDFPFNQLDWGMLTFGIYFSVIGITYFVPLDVAFSVWFFYVAYSFVSVAYSSGGYVVTDEQKSYQAVGEYVVYGITLVWLARHHLWHVLRSVGKPREPNEVLSYGAMVGGLLTCVGIATAFLLVTGVTWYVALLAVPVVLMWAMIIARIVAESGLLALQLPVVATDPLRLLGWLFGSTGGATAGGIRSWLMTAFSTRLALTDQRELLMPFASHALRLGAPVLPHNRVRFFGLLCGAVLLAMVASLASNHLISYSYGRQAYGNDYASTRFHQESLDRARAIADGSAKRNTTVNRTANVAYGAVAMAAIGIGRATVTGFPLHPIGLLVNNSYPIRVVWFSVMIAWAVKLLILHFGGARAFTRLRPLFIGLVVGSVMSGAFWAVLRLFVTLPMLDQNRILPG